MIGAEQVVAARKGPAPVPTAETIFPCAGDCGRLTRPTRMKLTEAPNTVTRKSRDMCGICYAKFDPPKHRTIVRTEPPEHKTAATLNSLDGFMAERRRRLAAREERRTS